jgi:hypothetical protein
LLKKLIKESTTTIRKGMKEEVLVEKNKFKKVRPQEQ